MATAAEALRKLTSGQTLTAEEKRLLNIAVTPEEEDIPEMPTNEEMAAADEAYLEAARVLGVDLTKIPQGSPGAIPVQGNTIPTQDNTKRQSAYDDLLTQFKQYGLESLVEPLKGLIADPSVSEGEFTTRLRSTEPYKKRFAANAARIGKGLTALNEANYLALEDQYQNVMRNYGLPASYYTKGELGRQQELEKFIAADVSAAELEERIITAQDRVMKSNPEVLKAIKDFYGDSISNGDILAYALNPDKALKDIQRKVTAAEIGGAAMQQGLMGIRGTAESLAAQGITKDQAQQGFAAVAEMAPRGSQLADIYKEEPYNQATAEAEVFNTTGAAAAARKRKKLTALETAAFSGSAGVGALGRDRAGAQSGAGLF